MPASAIIHVLVESVHLLIISYEIKHVLDAHCLALLCAVSCDRAPLGISWPLLRLSPNNARRIISHTLREEADRVDQLGTWILCFISCEYRDVRDNLQLLLDLKL